MIYDLLAIAVFLLCIIVGYVKGAAKTLLSLVGFFSSFLLAVFLGELITDLLYDNYLSTAIIESIRDNLATQSDTTTVSLPPFASFALSLSGFDYESALSSAVKCAPTAIATTFEAMVKPVIVSVLSFVFTSVIFILSFILFKIVVRKILLFVSELPVISTINRVLGALCGVINAVLILSFLAFLLKTFMPYMNDIPFMLSESTIYNSYIFYHFYSGNIFNAIISVI